MTSKITELPSASVPLSGGELFETAQLSAGNYHSFKISAQKIANLAVDGHVKFPATQLPSNDPNTLDDYEEGTWTATVADDPSAGNTTTTATGYYTKIGDIVLISVNIANIDTTGLTGSNALYIQGLPFTVNSSGKWMGACRLRDVTFAGNTSAEAINNTTSVAIIDSQSGGASGGLLVSAFADDSADVSFTITYKV